VTRAQPGWKLLVGGSAPGGMDRRLVRRFIELAGGPAAARLALVPSASEIVPETVASYRDEFAAEGVEALAVLDVRSREDADAPATLRKLAEATGVMFTGGDQLRLLEIFSGALFMAALRQRIREGLVIAGSSAGAMALGDPTIVRGEPSEFYEPGAIRHAPGLGLVPRVSIDTHFVVRDRLPRLVAVAAAYPDIVGLGIEENSGVEVSPEGVATVLGDGVVCVVEGAGRGALPARAGRDRALSVAGLTLHVLAEGASYDLRARRVLRT
jgi:cyanophycinase